jgi:PAS domain-containing protein
MYLYSLITLVLLVSLVTVWLRLWSFRRRYKQRVIEVEDIRTLLDHLSDGLLECDNQMVVKRMNHTAEKILGLEASKVISKVFERGAGTSDPAYLTMTSVLFPETITKTHGKSVPHPGLSGVTMTVYDVPLEATGNILRIFNIPKVNPLDQQPIGFIKVIRNIGHKIPPAPGEEKGEKNEEDKKPEPEKTEDTPRNGQANSG